MPRARSYSRTAIKFLLVADLLIVLTVIVFVLVAWTADLPLVSKVLATGFTCAVLAFAVPAAIRELRLLCGPAAGRVSGDD